MAPVTFLAHHVLAHQGGWDEALIVVGPIVAIIAVLMVAKRRVDRLARDVDADVDVEDR